MNVYLHKSVQSHPEGHIADLMREIVAIPAAGPITFAHVKALHGSLQGALRVRDGRFRAFFNVEDESSRRTVWIHALEHRKEVYDRRGLRQRVERWLKTTPRSFDGYVARPLPETASTVKPLPIVLPWLSEKQHDLLETIISVGAVGAVRRSFLRLAVGPPGSGKTVVAIEAAREAWLGGADVLYLVPSSRLVGRVRETMVDGEHIAGGAFAASAPEDAPRIWVERVQDFFRSFGSTNPSNGWLANWWWQALQLPALQRWKAENPAAQSSRFIELLDAAVFDERATGTKEKDALSHQDDDLRRALVALNQSALRIALEESLPPDHAFRWQLARAALPRLADVRGERDLVIIVDEAQDLAPGEWQTLVEAAWHRTTNGSTRTLLALLGDENQRITPSAFSWSDVQDFAIRLAPELASGGGLRKVILPGSHRTPANIARAATPLVDGSVTRGRHRRAETADTECLPPGGELFVLVADHPQALLKAATSIVFQGRDRDDRIIILPASDAPLGPHLDTLSVEEAKGLEWEAVVLLGLFPDRVDFDACARVYTRITRAWSKVLLCLSPTEWATLESTWREAGVPYQSVGEELLPAVLTDFIDTSGRETRISERVERMEAILESAESGGRPFPMELLGETYSMSLLRWGAGEHLYNIAATALDLVPGWEDQLKQATLAPDAERAAAAWLLLGDAGAALVHLETHAPLSPLRALVEELVGRGSAFHRASAALHRASGFERPISNLLREALLRRCLDRLEDPGQVDPPESLLMARTRWEGEVKTGIDGVHCEIEARMKQIAQMRIGELESLRSGLAWSLQDDDLSARIERLSARWDLVVAPIPGKPDDA